METGDWISLLMVLVALASVVVTYAVYRSSTDPEVLVYVHPDQNRPSVVNLVIKNIGNGPAREIVFSSSRSLPRKAWGIEAPDKMPEEMNDGPFISGVPYLAPGQEIAITWGQYGGLSKFIGTKPILLTIKYRRANKRLLNNNLLISESILDIQSFKDTDISDNNWDKKIATELKKINTTVADFLKDKTD